MKKLLFFLAVMTAFTLVSFTKKVNKTTHATLPFAAGKWSVDKSSSSIKFSVKRLVVETVEGKFDKFDGVMQSSKPDFSDAQIVFAVDANSINTEDDYRDKHLKGDEFFDVEKYPTLNFVSMAFKPMGGNNYKLGGKLTMHGVEKVAVFDVTYGGMKTEGGKQKASFTAKLTIDRFDYGLKWSKLTEAGGLVVSKEVEIVIDMTMVKN